jgi:hypothetical protein
LNLRRRAYIHAAVDEDFERVWRTKIQAAMVGLSTRGEQRFAETAAT